MTIGVSSGTNGNNKLDIKYFSNELIYFEAPETYLGNILFAYGKSLSFDVGDNGSGSFTSKPDVVLVGNGLTLVLDIPVNPPSNINLQLGHYDVTLAPSSAWHISTLDGITPSTTQFQSVLSSLTALRIRGAYHTSGVGGIDNIVLVPEPTSIGLFCLAAPVIALAYYSRTRRCS